MQKKFVHIIIFLLISVLGFSQKEAVINFSCQDNLRVERLSGKWEFYWMELLTPEQIKQHKKDAVLVDVPKSWNKYKINGQKLPHYGYATYHVKIIVPQKDKLYAIKFVDVFSAYKVWVNDSFCVEVGKVSDNVKQYHPLKRSEMVGVFTHSDTIDLVVQIANYSHKKAGLPAAPFFGYGEKIFKHSVLKIVYNFLIFGGLLIFAIFHFWLFFYRKHYVETLFFALSALAAAFYTFFDQELIITQFFPNLPWEIIYKSDYITDYSRAFFMSLYFYFLVRNYVNKIWRLYAKVILYIMGGLLGLVLVTTVQVYSYTLNLFLLLLGMMYVFGLIGFIKKIIADREAYGFIPLTGFIILGLAMLNDMFAELHLLPTVELGNVGIFIFVSTQSITLAQNHSRLYRTASRLAKHFERLDTIKRSLLEGSFYGYKDLLSSLHNYFDADNVYLFTNEKGELKLAAAYVYDKGYTDNQDELASLDKKVLKEFIDLALTVNKPVIISEKNKLLHFIKQKAGLEFKSLLVTRLGSRHNPMGVLYFEKLSDYFTPEQSRILQFVTTQITAIINNVKLFNYLEDINKNLMNIVAQRTAKIEEQNKELELRTIELDEKIEELRVTAEVINEMNKDLFEQKQILEKKNKLLSEQTEVLKKQKSLVEELNRQITDSVNYARRIQMALLNSESNLPKCPHFIIFKAQEVVSGDFWWYNEFYKYKLLVIGDTMMHGVAGAFMSILSFSVLSEVLFHLAKKRSEQLVPQDIIELFNLIVADIDIQGLEQIKLSVLVVDTEKNKISVDIGGNYGYLFDGHNIIDLHIQTVENYNAQIEEGKTEVILFTDGLIKELKANSDVNISEIIKNLSSLDLPQQKIYIENYLSVSEQPKDDILVFGIKFKI